MKLKDYAPPRKRMTRSQTEQRAVGLAQVATSLDKEDLVDEGKRITSSKKRSQQRPKANAPK